MSDQRLRLLVIEDDDLVASGIRMALPNNWRMIHSSRPEIPSGPSVTAALVDLHLTGDLQRAEGVNLIAKLHQMDPHLEIVAMSGDLDRDLMEKCLKAGASRFLAKPLTPEELLLTLEKIEALHLLRDATSRRACTPWIGEAESSQKVKRQIAGLKGESGPILIEGESGTGKEVAAALIHNQELSGRPFVTVNLAALPENVFESEFFGHVRGAFTGADQNKMGLAEAAHGGDLFLDEVEALPLNQQPKLLRFLESGEVRRVGAKDSTRVSVRVIAASNQDLQTMVKEGQFREDLLWRLNGKRMQLPALRDRKEDIAELAQHFLAQEKPRHNKTLADDAIAALQLHNWPGNVRELKRVCEQLCLYSPLPFIRAQDVRESLPQSGLEKSPATENISLDKGLGPLLAEFEAEIIRRVLARDSDIEVAINTLQISRSSLYKKLKDYQIELRSSN